MAEKFKEYRWSVVHSDNLSLQCLCKRNASAIDLLSDLVPAQQMQIFNNLSF
ncbi:MAG TPA: hypothetical protein VL307_18245 [Chitinophagaceae bacterium]|nr:hypothetical protein [Chitinophagaceae bacterium]